MATTISFWTGTWQSKPDGKSKETASRLSVDRRMQVVLGLRQTGDESNRSLTELEAASNYTGPSGVIKLS
jgi:hypothetical protein